MSTTKKARTQAREDVPEELGDRVGDEVWSNNPGEVDEESCTGSPTPPFTTSICDLPPELVREVFSYFSVTELCCQLSLVCQEWNSLAHDRSLWQRLYLGNYYSMRADFPYCRYNYNTPHDFPYCHYNLPELSSMEQLKILILHMRSDASEILRVVSLSCPQLQKLEIKNCKNLKEEDVEGVILGCPSISHLSLEASGLPSPSSYKLIARFNKLKVLNLLNCSTLESESLRFLADNLPSLQELIISYNSYLIDEDLIYFIDKKKATLTKLVISGAINSDDIYRACARCPELVSFGVSQTETMTDVDVNEIVNLNKLTWLEIRGAKRVTSEAFVCLFENPSAHKLVHIDLSCCSGVDNKVLMAIADNCPLLTILLIKCCTRVDGSGIRYLVRKCKKLEYLKLSNVYKTTNTAIKTIPKHLKNLKCLDLFFCFKVNKNVIKEVVYRLPNLEVVDSGGIRIGNGDSSSESKSEGCEEGGSSSESESEGSVKGGSSSDSEHEICCSSCNVNRKFVLTLDSE